MNKILKFNLFNFSNGYFINNKSCVIRLKSHHADNIYCENVNNHVKRMVLNKPKRRNSLSLEFMSEIEEHLSHIEKSVSNKEATTKVLIIKSSTPTFSSGHDLLEFDKTTSKEHHEIFLKAVTLMGLIENYFIPVIVSIHGQAAAAGCQLVASSDIAICGKSSSFSTPGILAGLFCSTPAVAMGRVLPKKIISEMIYTGESISAEKALQYGLVNHVVDNKDVDEKSEQIANIISSLSTSVMKLGKKCFLEQMKLEKQRAYEHACQTMVDNLQNPDCKEGIRAFLEKRKAHWD